MRLEWLKDVLTVAETGSFTEAAQRRHLTQSAFSRRIQMIEDYVGVELFDRSKKPIQLRPTTEDQRNQVAHIAGLLEQLADDLRRGDRMSGNRAVVASQHSLTTSLMPGLLKALHLDQPDIHIRLFNEGNSLALSVQDNGIGIPKEHQKHVFDKFYRVPTGNVHNVKGFGLGLFYVKTMCKEHKWKLDLHSEPNKGTTITIRMPQAK